MDLVLAPFCLGRSQGSPLRKPKDLFRFEEIMKEGGDGATGQSRTDDLLITNELLYQLSYGGVSILKYNNLLLITN